MYRVSVFSWLCDKIPFVLSILAIVIDEEERAGYFTLIVSLSIMFLSLSAF